MKRSTLVYSAILLLAGCGGTSALPPSSVPASPAQHRVIGSVIPDNLGPQDLLFVSNSNGLVNIYHFWQHTLAGVLTSFTKPMGMCVDNARNVYIADFGAEDIVEYTHGGALIRTINDAPYAPYGCAVDAVTGNLAVANDGLSESNYRLDGNVVIYEHAKGKPLLYGYKAGGFTTLSYDDSGDLLASDLVYYDSSYYGQSSEFYYLPKRGRQLLKMALPNSQFSSSEYGWPIVQSINYDGKYWVVTANNTMYRYSIGVKAQEIDYQALTGASGYVGELSFYRKTRTAPPTRIVAGDEVYYNKSNIVDYWKYPITGDPYATISRELDGPYGVAISLRISK